MCRFNTNRNCFPSKTHQANRICFPSKTHQAKALKPIKRKHKTPLKTSRLSGFKGVHMLDIVPRVYIVFCCIEDVYTLLTVSSSKLTQYTWCTSARYKGAYRKVPCAMSSKLNTKRVCGIFTPAPLPFLPLVRL